MGFLNTSLLVGLLFVVAVVAQSATPPRKSLAGPPSEFSLHEIPSPLPQGLTSTSVRFPVEVTSSMDGTVEWESSLPVDSVDGFVFSVFEPNGLDVVLYDPTGKEVPNLSQYLQAETEYVIGDDAYYSVPVSTYLLQNFPVGVYKLKLESSSFSAEKIENILNNKQPDGFVFLSTPTPVESLAYLSNYNLHQDTSIALTAQIYDTGLFGRFNGTLPAPLPFVHNADLLVEFPDGHDENVAMHDDGEWPDLKAGDGVYAGDFKATEAGNYVISTLLSGIDNAGNAFMRSTEHLISVISKTLSLLGSATGAISSSGDVLNIQLDVSVDSTNTATSVRGYAEVWGTQGTDLVPVAWIGGMVDISSANGQNYVTLALDLEWVALAEAQEPFLLQNVYLSDISTNIPITTVAEVKVDTTAIKNLADYIPEKPTEITKKMRNGKLPERYANRSSPKTDDIVEIVFVHGYCSKQNPWEVSDSFPEDEYYFLNPGASLDNDAFALKIAAFADPLDSYSLVGHSQGGMASTHLVNYYFTGASANTAPYSIQSVGTPYQGNSGAGSAADLIKTFGVGCGANPSLTPDGAALWLSGITTEARNEVYYYTTQYTSGLFSFCQWGVGLVLSAPNDGTTELKLASLSGAHNLGNTQGQCHTEGMKAPPQCYDDSRNLKIYDQATPDESLKKQKFLAKKRAQINQAN